jgi:Zn-dependent M16 (insulinase) family peptidase
LEDPNIQHIYDKFFRLLQHVRGMKRLRLSLYKKIAGIKKTWFGFLSNQEAALAKEYHAAHCTGRFDRPDKRRKLVRLQRPDIQQDD